MIDQAAREIGSTILTDYLAGTLDSGDFEHKWDKLEAQTTDPVIKAIGWAVWYTYSDIGEKRNTVQLTFGWRQVLERCRQFLQRGGEYCWSTKSPRELKAILRDPTTQLQWPFTNAEGLNGSDV